MLPAVAGVVTASPASSLGPHAAHCSVTPQHQIVVDLGPLGQVLLDSPLPWPLGVEVVVHEIPVELTAVPTSPVTGLAGDLAAYTQVAAHPRAVVADAAGALIGDADRKSTRLNSSHVASSYAVFCLKKKTEQQREAELYQQDRNYRPSVITADKARITNVTGHEATIK